MTSAPIDVLLATCNGARHLPALLDSLMAQTHRHWRLLVSDDRSTDATLEVLGRYQALLGPRLVLLPRLPERVGVVGNFARLMQASLDHGFAANVAFCDQDDVWLPEKLETLARGMSRLQARCLEGVPCVVHCDLAVVDADLRPLHPSFVRHQHYDPEQCSATAMLSINQVTGCAMLVNRAVLDLALPMPPEVVMHDWWCALLAGSGHRLFIDEPLVLYRQHGANQLGAKGRDLRSRALRVLGDAPAIFRRVRALGRDTRAQARALRTRLAERGLDNAYVRHYLAWRDGPWWRRVADSRGHYMGPALDRCARLLLW